MSYDARPFLTALYQRETSARPAYIAVPPLTPIHQMPGYDFTISDQPVSAWVKPLVENYQMRLRYHEALGDDAVPLAKIGTGTHLYAAAFGCTVHRFENDNPCAVPCVLSVADADKLTEPDIWSSPTLYRVFELARLVRDELGPDVPLGPPDMQSGFDTAALVWDKADFLCALADPDTAPAARRVIDICARLFKRFITELYREFPGMSPCHCPSAWSPNLGPWLSNDECGAISCAHFREFALPELIDLAESFGGLGMHCCADAEHQFDLFRTIPHFYAFNRVAAKRGYLPILDTLGGPDGPVHVLQWISNEQIRELRTQAPAGTRFIFCHDVTSVDEGRVWLEQMRAS